MMRYAVEIYKINKYGFISKNIFSFSDKDYFSYGEKIYGPIDGEVVDVVSNIEDNKPDENVKYRPGNFVTIKNGNYYVSLFHMKKGSIEVKKGQSVKQGDFIRCVGNSGYSIDPHLHIQAVYSKNSNYWTGNGVPILFDNKKPVSRMLFKIK